MNVRVHIEMGFDDDWQRWKWNPQSLTSGGYLGHVRKERNRQQSEAGIPPQFCILPLFLLPREPWASWEQSPWAVGKKADQTRPPFSLSSHCCLCAVGRQKGRPPFPVPPVLIPAKGPDGSQTLPKLWGPGERRQTWGTWYGEPCLAWVSLFTFSSAAPTSWLSLPLSYKSNVLLASLLSSAEWTVVSQDRKPKTFSHP